MIKYNILWFKFWNTSHKSFFSVLFIETLFIRFYLTSIRSKNNSPSYRAVRFRLCLSQRDFTVLHSNWKITRETICCSRIRIIVSGERFSTFRKNLISFEKWTFLMIYLSLTLEILVKLYKTEQKPNQIMLFY